MTNLELNYLNLGTYKMGTLSLPATTEEINEFFAKLNPNDNDCELQYVESDLDDTHLDKMNLDQLIAVAEMDESEAETFLNIMDAVGSFEDASEILSDGEYIIFSDCDSMEDVANTWINDHIGSIEDAVSTDRIGFYIDRDAVKRDLQIEGYFSNEEEETEEEEMDLQIEDLIEQGSISVETYFDYEAFGRDMEIEGTFHYTGNSTYIQILN